MQSWFRYLINNNLLDARDINKIEYAIESLGLYLLNLILILIISRFFWDFRENDTSNCFHLTFEVLYRWLSCKNEDCMHYTICYIDNLMLLYDR